MFGCFRSTSAHSSPADAPVKPDVVQAATGLPPPLAGLINAYAAPCEGAPDQLLLDVPRQWRSAHATSAAEKLITAQYLMTFPLARTPEEQELAGAGFVRPNVAVAIGAGGRGEVVVGRLMDVGEADLIIEFQRSDPNFRSRVVEVGSDGREITDGSRQYFFDVYDSRFEFMPVAGKVPGEGSR
jgi:hypothetical protein